MEIYKINYIRNDVFVFFGNWGEGGYFFARVTNKHHIFYKSGSIHSHNKILEVTLSEILNNMKSQELEIIEGK